MRNRAHLFRRTQTSGRQITRRVTGRVLALAILLCLLPIASSAADHPTSFCAGYAGDPVAQLQRRLDRGEARLSYNDRHGWLESVLGQLDIAPDSQGLVFSKTSFQASRISPQTPRALYFNDESYVGWVRGGDVLEVAAVDPKQGPVFYLRPQRKTERPKFIRQTAACMQCHQSQVTGDVPGLLMRSVYPDSNGMPLFNAGTFVTTDQSPLKERWGGWYVDGKAAGRAGMGDAIAADAEQPEKLTPVSADLSRQFDTARYLSPHSDAVALAVLAHQVHLHNLLTKAGCETRAALRDDAAIRQALHEKASDRLETTENRIKAACEPLVHGLLFCGEADLGPLSGPTDFAEHFQSLAPRDHHGRSLREFDLNRRLFKYPCSYLIYSQQFDALPDAARHDVYRRLWQVLTGRDDSKDFDHLSDPDRDAIYDILRETKKDLSADWKARE